MEKLLDEMECGHCDVSVQRIDSYGLFIFSNNR